MAGECDVGMYGTWVAFPCWWREVTARSSVHPALRGDGRALKRRERMEDGGGGRRLGLQLGSRR